MSLKKLQSTNNKGQQCTIHIFSNIMFFDTRLSFIQFANISSSKKKYLRLWISILFLNKIPFTFTVLLRIVFDKYKCYKSCYNASNLRKMNQIRIVLFCIARSCHFYIMSISTYVYLFIVGYRTTYILYYAYI